LAANSRCRAWQTPHHLRSQTLPRRESGSSALSENQTRHDRLPSASLDPSQKNDLVPTFVFPQNPEDTQNRSPTSITSAEPQNQRKQSVVSLNSCSIRVHLSRRSLTRRRIRGLQNFSETL
jgi:hypothetical protein